jgi:hypothetical protein
VARDGLLGESRPNAYLANAAVRNICLTVAIWTSTLPLIGFEHGQPDVRVLNKVLRMMPKFYDNTTL